MTPSFQHYPSRPNATSCEPSYVILCNAHDASSSFLEIFGSTRANRGARGAPTDEEQDLLRAMLSFASAGLDSMVKQLVVDALPSVIDRSTGAAESFGSFVEKRLYKGEEIDHRLIAEVLCDARPRDRLVKVLVSDLTSGSLQSTEAVFRAGSFFDIPSKDICSKPNELTKVFRARNEMVHEMDVDFNQSNRNRRPRRKEAMIENTNLVFSAANAFLRGVDNKLSA